MTQADPTSDVGSAVPPLDMKTVRFPAEPSRFVLAIVSVLAVFAGLIVWLIAVDVSLLLYGTLLLVFVSATLWLSLQLARVRLLGDAVLVSSQTLPDLQSAVDEVRATLQYDRRVDIFVVPNLSPRIRLTSYFGVRALLIEGGAVADITTPAHRGELLFLLGTYFGAFKAKHDRWAVAELILDNAGIRKLLAPVVAPWLRSTVYTGDQIAFVCCRDFRVSLAAVYRLLIGRELSSQLAAPGLILQAERVAHSPYLRMAEMFRSVPHTTNRFLNILRFAQEVDPVAVSAFRAGLAPDVNRTLDQALARMTRTARRQAGPVVTAIAVPVLTAVVVALLISPSWSVPYQEPPVADPLPEPVPTTEPADEPIPPAPSPAEQLAAGLPTEFAGSCTELSAPAGLSSGLVVAVTCTSSTGVGMDVVDAYSYDSSSALDDAVGYMVEGLDSDDCSNGGWSGWHDGTQVDRGVLACWDSPDGAYTLAGWSYDADLVLVVAAGEPMYWEDAYAWWQSAVGAFAFE